MNAERLAALRAFIPPAQLETMLAFTEERAHFLAKLDEFYERTRSMPRVYEQDGKGDDAVAFLHYFSGSYDAFITERDTSHAQLQAFGLAGFNGHDLELGYVSLPELFKAGVELDLYFKPTTLGAIRAQFKLPAGPEATP